MGSLFIAHQKSNAITALITLSGEEWPRYRWLQLWDVSSRHKPTPNPNFNPNGNRAPAWLSYLGQAISGIEPENPPFLTMSEVRQKFEKLRNGSPYYGFEPSQPEPLSYEDVTVFAENSCSECALKTNRLNLWRLKIERADIA